MKNQSKGGFLMALGWICLMVVSGVLYYMNAVGIWLSNAFGITGDAAFGVQVIVLLLALLLLSSVFMLGVTLIVLGIGYLKNITPFDLMGRIHTKIFGDTFSDRDFRM